MMIQLMIYVKTERFGTFLCACGRYTYRHKGDSSRRDLVFPSLGEKIHPLKQRTASTCTEATVLSEICSDPLN